MYRLHYTGTWNYLHNFYNAHARVNNVCEIYNKHLKSTKGNLIVIYPTGPIRLFGDTMLSRLQSSAKF